MEKIRVYMDDPETGERKYGFVTVDKLPGVLAKGRWKVAEQQAATTAAPVAPAAPAPAPTPTAAAPAKEGGLMDSLAALATGAGRGLTAEFLDEMRGAAAMLGAKYGSEGVAPEFLAQEDFYTQGREEEQARQRRLEQQSPFLTAAGQIGGAIAPALLTGGAAAAPTTLGARFAAAAPAAAGYAAATGVGRTDIIGTPATTEETAKELLQNVAVDTALGLGGAGLGAAAGQAASGVRGYVARKLAEFGSEADKLRVATAGPAALKAAEKGQGGVDVKETARVMREVNLGGVKTPAAIKAGAEKTEEEAGALINSIVSGVDERSAALLKQMDQAQTKLAATQDDLQKGLSDKVKAAEEAAAKAAEIEKAAAAANARLAAEQQEFFRAATTSGKAIAEKPIKEPGVVRLDKMDLQKAAKDAADEAAAKTAAAKEAMKAAQKQEKLTTKGSFAPDPLTGEAVLAPSGRDPLMFKAMILQNEADAATARAAQLAQDARAGAASFEQPMPIRAVVGASSAMKGRQREVDMVNAAAKKAREEADRLAKEAQPTAEQQAAIDEAKATIAKLSQEASKRMVSGDEVAKRLESRARSLMAEQGAQTPEQLDELTGKTYKKLVGAADQMRGRQLSLSEAQGRLRPLAVTARFEAGAPDIKVTAAAQGAREQSRAIREGMDIAAEEAFPTMAATPALESPLARVGKGARLTEPPTGKTGYQSARRVYDVMQDIIPAAEQQAARIRSEYGVLNPRRYAESYLPGLQATGAELAQTMAPRAETALLTPQERALRSLPYGAVAIEDMLRQIDEESAP